MNAEDYLEGQVIFIDKPLNWTSFQVVNKVRWLIRKKFNLKKIKVGHAGTLDPLATGLLILCTGKMTQQIEHFQGQEKTYTGTICLGATTPSYDLEQPINAIFPTEHIDEKLLNEAKKAFMGSILQTPPLFSAIKKDGKKLYELARAGKKTENTEIKKRFITIYEFDFEKIALPNVHFKIRCSKGTYIRSIADDFGKAVQSGGHLTALRRTRIGKFNVTEAMNITDFEAKIANED